MKKTHLFICSCLMAATFSACEMKDELWGNANEGSATAGQLQLQLINNAQADETLKRAEATDNGIKVGVFDPEELDVNNYTLEVTDASQGICQTGRLAELGAQNGSLTLAFEEGSYTAKAYNYDGSEVSVSTRPWFMGQKEFQILPGKSTNASVECKLQNIEVNISLAQSFKDDFTDDYTITVDNGDGAIQIFNQENIRTKYYFAVPESKNQIKVSVKATTRQDGQNIQRTYTVTKPADAENNTNLAAGDAFIINLKEDESTTSYIDFDMSVDFSFAEQEEIISLPTENITWNPEEGEDDTPDPAPADAITFEGLPATYINPGTTGESVVVTFHVEKGIKNLFVTITSDNEGFSSTLAGFGLGEKFDIANPGELEGILTGSLEKGEGIGLLQPGQDIKGETEYVFDVTSFMSLLGLYGNSENTFSIEVVDAEDHSKAGDLKVIVNDN